MSNANWSGWGASYSHPHHPGPSIRGAEPKPHVGWPSDARATTGGKVHDRRCECSDCDAAIEQAIAAMEVA